MGSKKTGIVAAFAAIAGLWLFAAAPAHATFWCSGYGFRGAAAAVTPAPAVRGYYGRRYGYGVGVGRRYGYGVGVGRRYGYGVGVGRRYGYGVGVGRRYGAGVGARAVARRR
jgi:hypothetical protein